MKNREIEDWPVPRSKAYNRSCRGTNSLIKIIKYAASSQACLSTQQYNYPIYRTRLFIHPPERYKK